MNIKTKKPISEYSCEVLRNAILKFLEEEITTPEDIIIVAEGLRERFGIDFDDNRIQNT